MLCVEIKAGVMNAEKTERVYLFSDFSLASFSL